MRGGPSGPSGLRNTDKILNKARDQIRRATGLVKNVFISFAIEDVDEVNALRMSARNDKSPIEFKDFSIKERIDSKRADYIKQQIREQIVRCSTTVVYLSEHSAKSPWVEWEIRKSVELGKTVIAVHKGDRPPRFLPPAVKELGIPVVPWKMLHDHL